MLLAKSLNLPRTEGMISAGEASVSSGKLMVASERTPKLPADPCHPGREFSLGAASETDI